MIRWLLAFLEKLERALRQPRTVEDVPTTIPVSLPQEEPSQEPVERHEAQPPEPVYSWDIPRDAFHLTRVMCNDEGLTLTQKNIVCACIYQESRFRNRHADGTPVTNPNKDPETGKVWSTDYGIVQVNDYWHIGKGKTFPNLAYVMDHPDKMVHWMVLEMKRTGKLQPWSSYTSGAYRQWLKAGSPMWDLAA